MSDLRAGIGPLGVWGHLDSLPATAVRGYVRRAAELRYGALWVPETVGREPFALLGAIAEAADGMWLGTSIVGIFGRDAMTAKLGAQTLHELTGGRFALGLGVSHPHLVEKLRGHPYQKPLSTMRRYVGDIHRLPYLGPRLDAGGSASEPPILVAALRERMIAFSAAETDGAFPYLVTPERVAWIREVLDANGAEGRPRPVLAVTQPCVLSADPEAARTTARAYLAPYLRPINYQASWEAQGFTSEDWAQPGSDRLVDAMVVWGRADRLRARIAAHHAAGADHVAVIPLSADGRTEDAAVLEVLAPAD